MESIEILTKSDVETKKLGTTLAREILKFLDYARDKLKTAEVLSLEGELGAGKTTFAQGFAKGLGIREIPRSPTFVIMQIYGIKRDINKNQRSRKNVNNRKFENFIHIDAYRVKSKDLKTLGWDDLIKNNKNIILVEWGNKIKNILPKNSMRITFKHVGHSSRRLIKIST